MWAALPVGAMQIVSIQVLRALAALSVAFGHAQGFIGIPLERQGGVFPWSYFLPWGAGVDLFFVISGFIMVYSSEALFAAPKGARIFLWRRLCRIVPLYWIMTCLVLCKGIVKGIPAPDAAGILASLFFIPWDTFGTGVARPLYELGWTLNYEMFFYVSFAIAIGYGREKAVMTVACILVALAACGPFVPAANAPLFVWSRPIIIEFIFGMGLALLARRGVTWHAMWRMALLVLGVAALLYDGLDSRAHRFDWITPNDGMRVLAWGFPAAMIVAAAIAGPVPWREGRLTRLGVSLGDASYALYLCHPIVMSALSATWFALKLNHVMTPWIPVLVSVVLSSLVALCIHRFFEQPVTEYLKALGKKSRVTRPESVPSTIPQA